MKSYIQFLVWTTFLVAPLVFAQIPEPVGHWPFNEGSGFVTADVSGNGNDGTIWSDGVFWSTDTPTGTGYSLEFAGKLGAVHIGDPDILKIVGDITLAAWVKTGPATENWQNIIVKGHGTATGEIVMRVDGQTGKHEGTQIWCGSYDGADHMVQSYSFTDQELNTWMHVVGTYSSDNQAWTLYLNGEWVNALTDPVGAVSVDRPWAVGARASVDGTYPSERHFEGWIDDVRILPKMKLRHFIKKPSPPLKSNRRLSRLLSLLIKTIPILSTRKRELIIRYQKPQVLISRCTILWANWSLPLLMK